MEVTANAVAPTMSRQSIDVRIDQLATQTVGLMQAALVLFDIVSSIFVQQSANGADPFQLPSDLHDPRRHHRLNQPLVLRIVLRDKLVLS